MRLLVLGLVCAACVESTSLVCPDGTVCPSSFICLPAGGCASPQALEACEGLVDGDPCRGGRGLCNGGLCVDAFCGNSVIEAPEVCDDGNQLGGDGCNGTCTSNEVCGNGLIELAEQCDCGDAEHPGLAICAGTFNGGLICNAACELRRCGDGVIDPGEVCDDGNLAPSDGCSFDCRSNNTCGNGIVDYFAGEQCDDSNARSLDSCGGTCRDESLTWEPVIRTAAPGRGFVSMAYDAARGRLVMFGGIGSDGSPHDDTWENDGNVWFERVFTTRPPARVNASMAYDAARARVVLFGGTDGADRNDTWEFDGARWHEVQPATRPPARSNASITYDAARKRIVLFGGRDGPTGERNDLWELDGANWVERQVTNPPATRVGAALGYDPVQDVLVLFGGQQGAAPFADTWELASGATAWAPRTVSGTPPSARSGASFVFDPVQQRFVLFGGISGSFVRDTFAYAGGAWTLLANTGPSPRQLAGIAFDLERGRVVLYGGNFSSETWELNGSTWSLRALGPIPFVCLGAAMVHDVGRGKTVLFGGIAPAAPEPWQVVWEFDGTSWTDRSFSAAFPIPDGRAKHAMAYDEKRRRVVMFGGSTQGQIRETWELDGTRWYEMPLTGAPSPRDGAAMTYDRKREVIVLFGGGDASDDTTYEYDATGWRTAITNTPGSRREHMMAYDAKRERVVLFGGSAFGGQPKYADTWEFDGNDWVETTPTVSPQARTGAAMYYDPVAEKIILFGGGGSVGLNDTWEYDGVDWRQRTFAQSPPTDPEGVLMAYVPHLQRGVMFMPAKQQTWTLGYSAVSAIEACMSGFDQDHDNKVACADDDCWGVCTPTCPPDAVASTCLVAPACGDAICDSLENCRSCPGDCAVGVTCPILCGDFYCDDVTETVATCPGDCL